MAILFSDKTYRSDKLYELLVHHMPDHDIRKFPEIGNPDDIDFAVVWIPYEKSLLNLPNLKMIFTVSAGVDGVMQDDTLPNIPICRFVDDALTKGMVEHILYHVLKYHRDHHLYDQQQRQKTWQQHRQIAAEKRTVGIMGLGEIGRVAATHLTHLDFNVIGWSRSAKDIPDVQSYVGSDGFNPFLERCDILVNVLPLTPETKNILCKQLFDTLPKGAYIINCGRGGHLNEEDLLDALSSKQISAASLDVFKTEPLPATHVFWDHPQITLTPHIGSISDFQNITTYINAQITRVKQGEDIKNIINRTLGY